MALAASAPFLVPAPLPLRPAISLRAVSKSYLAPSGLPRTVLANIHLSIQPGEFVVILGQTGCGKSTLLRLILGEELPSTGSIDVAGRPVRQIDARCGYVPQRYSLFPNLTALENVTFGPRTARYHLSSWLHPSYWRFRSDLGHRALAQLTRMGLSPSDADKFPHRLSGGMQQRVAIAQALILHPSVLLLDEAFSALDPSTRISLQELLLSIWREQHPTLVFVTHNVAEALFLGTRLIVLAPHSPDNPSNILADLPLPPSELPYLELRHRPEFLKQLAYIEQLSYDLHPPNPKYPPPP